MYHLKRKGRNEFARRLPSRYAAHIERVSRGLPALNKSTPTEAALELSRVIAPFYRAEYLSRIDDVTQGRFSFFGKTVSFPSAASVDWHHKIDEETDFHLWRMKLGHMGFVSPMLSDGTEHHHLAVAELLSGYRERADFGTPGCFTSYWFPYSVSHRILAILSGYNLGYDSISGDLRDEISAFLRWNAAFVSANIEHELRNNHVERNLAALCFYYSCAQSVPARVASRLDREVRRVIAACVLSDGFIAERSAMYQGLTVMALAVFARTPFLSARTRRLAGDSHLRALQAWATMTHADGEIALFNDSWFEEVPPISEVVGNQVPAPATLLPEAGYARLESDDMLALMDAGPIGPNWNPGHGHADFLSFEADIEGKRFVVDPGTYQYSTGSRRTFERSARSHNGPHSAGYEPVDYAGCFRVGRMSEARFSTATRAEASGTLPVRGGGEVSRTITVASGLITVADEWSNSAGAGVTLTVQGEWRVISRNATTVEFEAAGLRTTIETIDGTIAQVRTGEWSCRYLSSEPATIVELTPRSRVNGGARAKWQIRKQDAA